MVYRADGYRWINRYKEVGPGGLVDRGRGLKRYSYATLEPIEDAVLSLRAKHASWGARKLKAKLKMLRPGVVWPAARTVDSILSRAGLTSPQKKRNHTTPCQSRALWSRARSSCSACISKAFTTGDGKRCDPFTIDDAYSRYVIRCQIVSRMDLSQVRAICDSSNAGVWNTSTHQDGQRRALCGHGAPGTIEAFAWLDEARDRA